MHHTSTLPDLDLTTARASARKPALAGRFGSLGADPSSRPTGSRSPRHHPCHSPLVQLADQCAGRHEQLSSSVAAHVWAARWPLSAYSGDRRRHGQALATSGSGSLAATLVAGVPSPGAAARSGGEYQLSQLCQSHGQPG